mgnify:CR=1 FL=1
MKDSKETLNEMFKDFNGNIFGWKWSYISLIIIIIGVIIVWVLGPGPAMEIDSSLEPALVDSLPIPNVQ